MLYFFVTMWHYILTYIHSLTHAFMHTPAYSARHFGQAVAAAQTCLTASPRARVINHVPSLLNGSDANSLLSGMFCCVYVRMLACMYVCMNE